MSKKILISESHEATRNAIEFACQRAGFEPVIVERLPTKKEFLKPYKAVVAGFVTSANLQTCRVNEVTVLTPVCFLPLKEREEMETAELAGNIQFIAVSASMPMRLAKLFPEPVAEEANGDAEEDILAVTEDQVVGEGAAFVEAGTADSEIPF